MVTAQDYAVIVDRDQTLNADPGYLNNPDEVVLLPGTAEGILLLNQFHIRVYVATNQSGVARGFISHVQLDAVNAKIVELLATRGAHLEKFYVCPHGDDDQCDCRKPKSGLVQQIIAAHNINPTKTFIIGDRARDLECGIPFGIPGILVGNAETETPENMIFRATNLQEAAAYILEAIFEAETQTKIFASGQVFLPTLAKIRNGAKQVVFTNGCFDILHSGHVQLLAQARALGDYLILGLNSDRSVRSLKGDKRPINRAKDRARILAQLPYVDAVVIFDEDTPVQLMQLLQPDVQVKGGDYVKEKLPEYAVMKNMGKEIVILPFRKGYSTTNILAKS